MSQVIGQVWREVVGCRNWPVMRVPQFIALRRKVVMLNLFWETIHFYHFSKLRCHRYLKSFLMEDRPVEQILHIPHQDCWYPINARSQSSVCLGGKVWWDLQCGHAPKPQIYQNVMLDNIVVSGSVTIAWSIGTDQQLTPWRIYGWHWTTSKHYHIDKTQDRGIWFWYSWSHFEFFFIIFLFLKFVFIIKLIIYYPPKQQQLFTKNS